MVCYTFMRNYLVALQSVHFTNNNLLNASCTQPRIRIMVLHTHYTLCLVLLLWILKWLHKQCCHLKFYINYLAVFYDIEPKVRKDITISHKTFRNCKLSINPFGISIYIKFLLCTCHMQADFHSIRARLQTFKTALTEWTAQNYK